ncbi:hypothetical protein H4P12_16785 [Paracoccus sp. 11-3]|uniref:Uncharacterized protein n=1 Tax=Paracoccus amoyensis TaxID=2760093 RepID=A0A926GGR6_9RHOB|nr:hypothetical protein [Paracoccus amoyensis]MBC9248326.1 hypothetical protein [Paracoccus amoyensis]
MSSPDKLISMLERAAPVLESLNNQEAAKIAYQEIVDALKDDREHRATEAARLWAYRRFALLLAFSLGIGTMLIAGFSVYKSGSVSIGTGLLLSSILALGSAFLWGFRPQKELDGSASAFSFLAKRSETRGSDG